MERRLTAILAADVQGYTHHTERNEEASTTTLRLYRAVVEEAIFAHKGHIFSSAGDGVVAEFYGTGVNVVARLEQLAVLGAYASLKPSTIRFARSSRSRFRTSARAA